MCKSLDDADPLLRECLNSSNRPGFGAKTLLYSRTDGNELAFHISFQLVCERLWPDAKNLDSTLHPAHLYQTSAECGHRLSSLQHVRHPAELDSTTNRPRESPVF